MSTTTSRETHTKKKRVVSLPEPLSSFTQNELSRLLCEDVELKEAVDGFDPGPHLMVTGYKVITSDGGKTIVRFGTNEGDVKPLNNAEWCKLGGKMGLSKATRKTTVAIRIGLAIHAHQECIIQSRNVIPIPRETTGRETQELRCKCHDTLVHLINALFSDEFIQQFLKMNDRRNLSDHEIGDGGNMQHFFEDIHKALYPTMASPTDDKERDDDESGDGDEDKQSPDEAEADSLDSGKDRYTTIDFIDTNVKLQELQITEDIDPSDYLTGVNIKSLEEWTHDLLAGRKRILQNKHKSGEGTDNDFEYTEAALKHKGLLHKIGVFPLYYFSLKAKNRHDFDQKFSPFLREGLKGGGRLMQ